MLVILVITGLAIGIISALFGVGGGILSVPVLYALFPELPPETVISSSLGMISINSALNTFNFIRQGKRPITSVAITMGVGIALGVITGRALTAMLNPLQIKTLFGLVLIAVALRLILARSEAKFDLNWKFESTLVNTLKATVATFTGGVLAGLTGLGGGAVMVPLFITVLKIPFNWVSVYSNVCMAFGTLVGVVSFGLTTPSQEIFTDSILAKLQWGYVNFGISLLFFAGAALTSGIGVRLSQKISPARAKTLFALLLIIMAIRILWPSFATYF